MKRFIAATTAAIALFTAPAAHAGITAQNSSEAVQFSSEDWALVPQNIQWNLTHNPFPQNLVEASSAGGFFAMQATLISAYHWVVMTLNQIVGIFAH